MGELTPSGGDILIDGVSVSGLSVSQRSRMGLSRSYQKNNLFEDLTVRENLTLAAAAAQGKIAWLVKDSFRDKGVKEAVAEAAELVSLTDLLDTPVKAASYGNRRQLEVGIALATRPKLLLMDEAMAGMNPKDIDEMVEFLLRLKEEEKMSIIAMVEHIMRAVAGLAERVMVMHQGAKFVDAPTKEALSDPKVVEVYLGHPKGE